MHSPAMLQTLPEHEVRSEEPESPSSHQQGNWCELTAQTLPGTERIQHLSAQMWEISEIN